MRKVERMTQRKRMSLTKVWKMLMVWKLLKRATSSSYCKKCEVNFKKQEKFRRHLIEGHKTNARRRCNDIFHTRTKLSRSWN